MTFIFCHIQISLEKLQTFYKYNYLHKLTLNLLSIETSKIIGEKKSQRQRLFGGEEKQLHQGPWGDLAAFGT